jgi:hypothetical protein
MHRRHTSAAAAGDVTLSQDQNTQPTKQCQAAKSISEFGSQHVWAPYLKARGLLLGCRQQFLQYNGSNLRHMAPESNQQCCILS